MKEYFNIKRFAGKVHHMIGGVSVFSVVLLFFVLGSVPLLYIRQMMICF